MGIISKIISLFRPTARRVHLPKSTIGANFRRFAYVSFKATGRSAQLDLADP